MSARHSGVSPPSPNTSKLHGARRFSTTAMARTSAPGMLAVEFPPADEYCTSASNTYPGRPSPVPAAAAPPPPPPLAGTANAAAAPPDAPAAPGSRAADSSVVASDTHAKQARNTAAHTRRRAPRTAPGDPAPPGDLFDDGCTTSSFAPLSPFISFPVPRLPNPKARAWS